MFSNYLKSKHDLCKELVNRLSKKYEYVSILGKQIVGTSIRVSTFNTSIGDPMEKQCGFVVRYYNGHCYSEYSFSDITEESINKIEKEILDSKIDPELLANTVKAKLINDEPLVKDFYRPVEGKIYTRGEIVEKLTQYKDKIHQCSKKVIQAMAGYIQNETSSMFISKNRDLTQDYTWTQVMCVSVVRDGANIKNNYDVVTYNNAEKCFEEWEHGKIEELVKVSEELLNATLIEPGVYDIITTPSITGLIAHEAFGHGVEMDMFVKHRAKSRNYINKPVASPLVNMHDGAAATLSSDSYFFDDDGVLAHDTLIIKNGILQTGISDVVSAMELGTEPTGNGRRQDPSRKAYTRMTNTFFSAGKDKVEDMIKSIKHGYMLYQTNNGMEDPKNWNIQCTASYGREIKDGKFTGKIVSPVVMSGYVPDLLMSISMVSDKVVVTGSGHCGKGYKEWVTVSDGGPYLKARCKLG